MGELAVTEAELPKGTDALQAHGIEQTALHMHLPEQSPSIAHFWAMEDAVTLAKTLHAALDTTNLKAAG